MTGVQVKPELTEKEKEKILKEVYHIIQKIQQQSKDIKEAKKVVGVAAPALAYLKGHSIAELEALLERGHPSTASNRYWQSLREVLMPVLQGLREQFSEGERQRVAVLYLLGWLRRAGLGLLG